MADFTALGAELVRLGAQRGNIQGTIDALGTRIQGLENQIQVLQTELEAKRAELSGIEDDQRKTFDNFATGQGIDLMARQLKQSPNDIESPRASQSASSPDDSGFTTENDFKPRALPPPYGSDDEAVPGVRQGISHNGSRVSISSVRPPTTRPLPQSRTYIHPNYPNVIRVGKKYLEVSCSECGANSDATNYQYFIGLKGIRQHCKIVHSRDLDHNSKGYFNSREISEGDVILLENGEEPRDHAIQTDLGHPTGTNKRDSSSSSQRHQTEYERYQALTRDAVASVANGWQSPSMQFAQKRRKLVDGTVGDGK